MDYIPSCLQDLVENGAETKPDSDLVSDLGLGSIKVVDPSMMLGDRLDISIFINILLDVKTPVQLAEALLPWLENNQRSYTISMRVLLVSAYNLVTTG